MQLLTEWGTGISSATNWFFSSVSSKSSNFRDRRAEDVAGYVNVEGRKVLENGGALRRKFVFLCDIFCAKAWIFSACVCGLEFVCFGDGLSSELDPDDELSSFYNIKVETQRKYTQFAQIVCVRVCECVCVGIYLQHTKHDDDDDWEGEWKKKKQKKK